jgi:RHS repeat-associated protein
MIFNYNNRLTDAGGTSYTYDAEDNRISSTVGGVTTNYVYDTTGSLSRMLESTDSTGKTVYYIYGMGLIGSEDNSGNYSNYHYDYRGSTTAITNSAGSVTDRYTYGTYGDLLSHTGSSTSPFLYNGRDGVMAESNGLYYMRSRYYSPELKRFINADVLKGAISSSETLNQYAYANGNPVSMVDPFGTSAEPSISSSIANKAESALSYISPLYNIIEGISGKTIVTGQALTYDERNNKFDEANDMIVNAALMGSVKGGGKLISTSNALEIEGMGGKLAKGVKNPEIVLLSKPHTNGTQGHWETILDEVDVMKNSGDYKKVYVNKGLSNEISGAKPNRRPDVMGVRHDGIIDQVEVPSKTDDPADLIERMIDNQRIIGDRAGTIKVIPIDK